MYKKLRQYTWVHCKDNLLSLLRLDRFYTFKYQVNIFKSCKINPVGFSDHSAVICSVLLSNIKSSSAYWHFNTSLTDDNNFKDSLIFSGMFLNNKSIYIVLYNSGGIVGKYKLKSFCQQYTFTVNKRNNTIIKYFRD